ncbi:hypothetical protein [Ereboglobus luteus]|uniref:Uncharacterized protein n=1 Tax=Ereboglobus luteus TaxID=1796921 RepID=A0A2U8E478_9BACT|nr:hypothetical protein [Ereboglobus luteus]AWI09728.1 hypothetical protein CKA38_11115 [Ereboglobus luteus]
MNATLDIPDNLYRRVKAKSALTGKPVRAIAISLFSEWLDEPDSPSSEAAPRPQPAWFGIARPYAEKVASHDMASVRKSIEQGCAKR